MRKYFPVFTILIAALGVTLSLTSASSQTDVKSRAYVGHASDRDIHNFVSQYPDTVGTRLDDCQTCHRGGIPGTDTEREYSPCGYCHLLPYPNARYKTGVPKSYKDTLNSYGLAYDKQGRSTGALAAISAQDSDGDGHSNAQEISDLRYPGDSASRPGQPKATIVTLDWSIIRKLPTHSQFMLMNTTSEPFDDYTSYSGVKVRDLLKAARIDLKGATGITVFAPDGYSIDYTIEDISAPFPKSYFYADPGKIGEKERMFVHYPENIPSGILNGKENPTAPWLLLAFERDGKPLEISQYEKGTGRLTGEGPYRLVKPQKSMAGDTSKPGRPDRSIKSRTFGDGWDFDAKLDHNAGSCVRGATVIRINPMPGGFEEYDWKNGWPLVTEKKLVIFGRGVIAK